MVVNTLTQAPQESNAEPLSPELVLVSPELRVEMLRRLRAVEAARVDPTVAREVRPNRPPAKPTAAPAWRVLVEGVEVSARVPLVLVLALWGAVSIVRVMVVIGAPVVLAVALFTLLGS